MFKSNATQSVSITRAKVVAAIPLTLSMILSHIVNHLRENINHAKTVALHDKLCLSLTNRTIAIVNMLGKVENDSMIILREVNRNSILNVDSYASLNSAYKHISRVYKLLSEEEQELLNYNFDFTKLWRKASAFISEDYNSVFIECKPMTQTVSPLPPESITPSEKVKKGIGDDFNTLIGEIKLKQILFDKETQESLKELKSNLCNKNHTRFPDQHSRRYQTIIATIPAIMCIIAYKIRFNVEIDPIMSDKLLIIAEKFAKLSNLIIFNETTAKTVVPEMVQRVITQSNFIVSHYGDAVTLFEHAMFMTTMFFTTELESLFATEEFNNLSSQLYRYMKEIGLKKLKEIPLMWVVK